MKEAERTQLIETLEKLAAETNVSENNRAHDRVSFSTKPFPVTFHHPGGVETSCLVVSRNLSAGGLGFLHGGFVYEGTRCVLEIPTIYGDSRTLTGDVRSCRHISGNVHDIGVRFDEPVDPYEFLEAGDTPQGSFSVDVDAPNLAGSVLAILAFPPDAQLLKHHLADTSIELQTAPDFESAAETVAAGELDLVIVGDHALGANGGADVIQAVRMQGFEGHLIALTADGSSDWLASVKKQGFSEILVKPYEVGKLYAVLAARLPDGSASALGGIFSELANAADALDLLQGFLREVESSVKEINVAMSKGDRSKARSLCLRLKGSGRGYGYPRLSDAAREVVDAIDADASGHDVEVAFRRLEIVFQCLTAEPPDQG